MPTLLQKNNISNLIFKINVMFTRIIISLWFCGFIIIFVKLRCFFLLY